MAAFNKDGVVGDAFRAGDGRHVPCSGWRKFAENDPTLASGANRAVDSLGHLEEGGLLFRRDAFGDRTRGWACVFSAVVDGRGASQAAAFGPDKAGLETPPTAKCRATTSSIAMRLRVRDANTFVRRTWCCISRLSGSADPRSG